MALRVITLVLLSSSLTNPFRLMNEDSLVHPILCLFRADLKECQIVS